MEAQTDIQTYLEQGKQALAQGQGREAAIAYAHGAQMEPDNPMVHLGLAEANLALRNYSVVLMACQRVQELQQAGGIEAETAQALRDLLDRRYERALQHVDAAISQDPGIAYVHALRAYLLRMLGQDYDANLARARSARLAYGGRFEGCFPPAEPAPNYASGYNGSSTDSASEQVKSPRPEKEAIPTWSRPPNQMQRQLIRARFTLSRHVGIVTNVLIGINVIVYLITAILSRNLSPSLEVLVAAGAQNTPLIEMTGQYWRIFTAMFLHFNLIHIGLNMLSLFLIGRAAELYYGWWRYLLIYLAAGIGGGIATFFLQSSPEVLSAGASGAIFGILGALGTFYLANRRALAGTGAITNWLFWLGLNLVWGFSTPGIGITDHIGGLIVGMLLAYLLLPRLGRRNI
ncbi:MAG TPA: rhomboid family intramembrane serine protease [Ktedonosporobacter sp.]|nr:rhomboid family intramembrane serine protease [Ktedonosporobacter sp.]